MPADTARSLCVLALREWEQSRHFADEVLHATLEHRPLSPVDRALFTETFYGILRNLTRLDFLIERLGRPDVDPQTRRILRLGLYQIFHMRIPDHAAVNETVDLARRARKLVNALLRRSLREKEELSRAVEDADLPIRMSHPPFLVDRWQAHFGYEAARALCEWNNSPAPIYVRANTLKVTAGELRRAAPDAAPSPFHPLALKVRQIPFLWIASGLCYVQDPSTLVATDLLDPQPGEMILDACAAPGGKTSHILALMQNQGRVVACDASHERLTRLRENLERLGADRVEVLQEDWLGEEAPFPAGTFDRILVDAPCTNTGVIQRRIDVRWRLQAGDFARMASRQFALVKSVEPLLKPGGVLVFSTCSLEHEENQGVVERIQRELPMLRLVGTRQVLPFQDGVDGAFAAKFEKT